MDIIQNFLASLLDKFKVSSPLLFTVVVAILTGLKVMIDGNAIPLDPKIATWVLWVVALFVNSSTYKFTNK
jgi:hypothetical protein